jgi:hypothetical protein
MRDKGRSTPLGMETGQYHSAKDAQCKPQLKSGDAQFATANDDSIATPLRSKRLRGSPGLISVPWGS